MPRILFRSQVPSDPPSWSWTRRNYSRYCWSYSRSCWTKTPSRRSSPPAAPGAPRSAAGLRGAGLRAPRVESAERRAEPGGVPCSVGGRGTNNGVIWLFNVIHELCQDCREKSPSLAAVNQKPGDPELHYLGASSPWLRLDACEVRDMMSGPGHQANRFSFVNKRRVPREHYFRDLAQATSGIWPSDRQVQVRWVQKAGGDNSITSSCICRNPNINSCRSRLTSLQPLASFSFSC